METRHLSLPLSTSELRVRFAFRETGLSPPGKYFTDRSKAVLLLWIICVSHAFTSAHCCLVVTCWESVDLLALVGDVYCIFVTFPCGILGHVWYLVVSIPDLCRLSYFNDATSLSAVCDCGIS